MLRPVSWLATWGYPRSARLLACNDDIRSAALIILFGAADSRLRCSTFADQTHTQWHMGQI